MWAAVWGRGRFPLSRSASDEKRILSHRRKLRKSDKAYLRIDESICLTFLVYLFHFSPVLCVFEMIGMLTYRPKFVYQCKSLITGVTTALKTRTNPTICPSSRISFPSSAACRPNQGSGSRGEDLVTETLSSACSSRATVLVVNHLSLRLLIPDYGSRGDVSYVASPAPRVYLVWSRATAVWWHPLWTPIAVVSSVLVTEIQTSVSPGTDRTLRRGRSWGG